MSAPTPDSRLLRYPSLNGSVSDITCMSGPTHLLAHDCLTAFNKLPNDQRGDPNPATFSRSATKSRWQLPQVALFGSCLAIVELGLFPHEQSTWVAIKTGLNTVLICAIRTAVFTSPPDPREPKVSGVGINDDPQGGFYVVPSSYYARWDDERDRFTATEELPLMRQSPWEGRHGFILHAACYTLLKEFFGSKGVPVARILEVCKSLPCQYYGLSWGHDYGGIVCADQEYQYPWEDKYLEGTEQPDPANQRADPWNIPELKGLLEGAQLGLPKKHRVFSNKSALIGGRVSNNYFTKLPVEILEWIMTYLTIDDVRNFVQTSKSLAIFVPSSLGQSFWASRFQKSFELDFIFETQGYRDRLDWRALYYGVMKAMHCSSGLQNRKRIWSLIRSPVWKLVCKDWSNSSELHFREASKDHLGRRERVSIPIPLRQIAVSTTSIANATYVTGVRFVSNKGMEVRLGYTAEGNQSSLDTANQFVDALGVQGLILAVGTRGIQALQFMTCAEQLSQWFGRPDGLPRTRRLVTSECIATLEAGFDGFKMVSLAIVETTYPRLPVSADEAESLRETALWFPEIPERHLYLNETSFTGIKTPLSEFRPLCYILLGAPGVNDLQNLTKVSVVFQHYCIIAIEFHYDTGNIKRLGPRRQQPNADETSSMLINGAQGECIKMIEVGLDPDTEDGEDVPSFWKHGRLESFKIITNRGRREHFRAKCLRGQSYSLKPMEIVPGTTLTGLYAGWVSETLFDQQV
ncbi:MAG: hypothetical protein Q9163_004498 [Psora crenata]